MSSCKIALFGAAIMLAASGLAGCTEPEIAQVLEDYCQFHKDCGYATVTQFKHSISGCERFHKDLLKQSSDGQPSGCKDQVEDFFIDFMHAQMAAGCSADLMQSLNQSPATQQQLTNMLACTQNGGTASEAVASMGLNIIERLDLDVNHMSNEVCTTIVQAIIPNQEDRVNMVCGMDLSKMDVETCNSLFEALEAKNLFSFPSLDYRKRICGLFKRADPA